jgi:hypothetical protein
MPFCNSVENLRKSKPCPDGVSNFYEDNPSPKPCEPEIP